MHVSSTCTVKAKRLDSATSMHNSLPFPADGQLLVCTDDSGLVQIINLEAKAALRRMRGHVGAVRQAKFADDNVHVCTAGDDKVRIYVCQSP
jgi:hypothetical protein